VINFPYYLLTLLVIAVSGNPAALLIGKEFTYIFVFIILLLLWIKRPIPINGLSLLFPMMIGLLTMVHFVNFGTTVLMANLGFLVKIGIGILAAIIIKDFFRIYVRWLAIMAIVSLFFYLPSFFGIDLFEFLYYLKIPLNDNEASSSMRHIGIHNFHSYSENRNSGFFWEPGAFAGYLALALFIMVSLRKTYSFHKWEYFIIISALISTQSTMGYLVGAVILIYFVVRSFSNVVISKKIIFFPLVISVVVIGTLITFTELEFVGDKIIEQIANTEMEKGNYRISRFGNVLYDLEFIQEKPLFGWSGNPQTRIALDGDALDLISAQGVGLTGFCVRFGVVGWLLLFIILYKNSFDKLSGLFFIAIICIILIGEQFTNYPFIYAFLVPVRSLWARVSRQT
jgi:hypothetical protein